MSAIAKGLVLGLAAAAKRNHVFTRWNRDFIAKVIVNLDGRRQNERSIFSAANGNCFRHDSGLLLVGDPGWSIGPEVFVARLVGTHLIFVGLSYEV